MDEQPTTSLWKKAQGSFLKGLAIFIPVALTIWVIELIFLMADGIIAPLFVHLLGRQIPGLGLLSVLLIIFLLGVSSRYLLGTLFVTWLERLFTFLPVVRTIYTAARDLMKAFSFGSKGKTFRKVLMVEYPRKGLYTIGFLTNEIHYTRNGKAKERMLCVYILNPPNPTSGVLILVPETQATPLEISVEEGLKMVLSGGIVSPAQLQRYTSSKQKKRSALGKK